MPIEKIKSQGAIYHLVASYGLKFEIGDTPFDLAKHPGWSRGFSV